MEITFNDQKQEIEEQTSVQSAMNKWIGEKQKGIAIAINDSIIPKAQWESHILHHGDNILVIKATQGG